MVDTWAPYFARLPSRRTVSSLPYLKEQTTLATLTKINARLESLEDLINQLVCGMHSQSVVASVPEVITVFPRRAH